PFPLLFVHYAHSFYILVVASGVRQTNRPERVGPAGNPRHRQVPQIEPPHWRLTGTERDN
ncbi:MAG: hypothetical protein WBQ94_00985, partial [Terracidiphilus sp.]